MAVLQRPEQHKDRSAVPCEGRPKETVDHFLALCFDHIVLAKAVACLGHVPRLSAKPFQDTDIQRKQTWGITWMRDVKADMTTERGLGCAMQRNHSVREAFRCPFGQMDATSENESSSTSKNPRKSHLCSTNRPPGAYGSLWLPTETRHVRPAPPGVVHLPQGRKRLLARTIGSAALWGLGEKF